MNVRAANYSLNIYFEFTHSEHLGQNVSFILLNYCSFHFYFWKVTFHCSLINQTPWLSIGQSGDPWPGKTEKLREQIISWALTCKNGLFNRRPQAATLITVCIGADWEMGQQIGGVTIAAISRYIYTIDTPQFSVSIQKCARLHQCCSHFILPLNIHFTENNGQPKHNLEHHFQDKLAELSRTGSYAHNIWVKFNACSNQQ